ncbi:Pectin lyase-like superfamily protein [Arabidopsis thaliana]|uniref:Pectin lyase-like superfamily protein n=1 Tax=Arabidopsis thaliana TaxID=3702 RepID=F4K4C2_ARATH|nr:Pectin lyase-like superfamily protein [Arabidopsis thaliana]AED93697.1 Pectin lyase-like superfamily protein [Arabidopsis thaliana]|eukprot:NP_198105.2 Pectin lyase-like superfamily protein [Arabidopsis thaliana]
MEDMVTIQKNGDIPAFVRVTTQWHGLMSFPETILRISILINFICFGLVNGQIYNVLKFGAEGDGQTDDSNAFLQAWNATCGGEENINTLFIPSGKTYLLQPIEFKGPCKSTSIKLQLDGIIVAPSNITSWSNPKSQTWISFSGVPGLMIDGSGTINGRGSSFWEALHICNCNNLTINGITSIDSPKSHISIKNCHYVAISKINILAPENSPNTDGIDISYSTNVNIFDSTIQTGDDCIAINTGSSSINITQVNCGPGHGISVGSLGADGENAAVSDVYVTQCTFNKTTNGARIKTWQGGQGYARNISFENITLINVQNPIIIDQQYTDKVLLDATKDSAVAISSVKYVGFQGTTLNEDAIMLKCSAITYCKDMVIDDIEVTMENGEKPKVECENVEGESSDNDLMRECFNSNSTFSGGSVGGFGWVYECPCVRMGGPNWRFSSRISRTFLDPSSFHVH